MTAITMDWKDRLSAFWQERKPLVKRRLPAYVLTGLAIYTFTRFYACAYVDSPSIHGTMVWITLEQPGIESLHRGELVFLKYAGRTLESHQPGDNWVKYVRGLPGDRVEVKNRVVYVNGELIGKAKNQTRHGTPLAPTTSGVIPPGHIFIGGVDPNSFDSRYAAVSLQPISAVQGRAKVLF